MASFSSIAMPAQEQCHSRKLHDRPLYLDEKKVGSSLEELKIWKIEAHSARVSSAADAPM